MTRALSIGLVVALAACSPTAAANDAGGTDTGGGAIDTGGALDTGNAIDTGAASADAGDFAADCAIYCQGFYSCGNATTPSCRFTMAEAAFRSECETACVSAAATMTPTEVTEATTCLHCLDGFVDQSTCTGTGLADAGGNNALFDAVMTCGAGCMTSGVMTINDLMVTTFLNYPPPDAGRYACSDAGP